MLASAIWRLPERAFGPVAGTALLLFVWTGVAHASGSGWVQAVGSVVAGLLLLGLVAPAFAAPGLTVICERSPSDTTAGLPVQLDVVGNRSMRCTPRSIGGAPLLLNRRIPARLVIVPTRRGVITSVTLRVATAAPFGLLWWSRDQVIELPRPLHVAPEPREPDGGVFEAPSLEEGHRPPRPTVTGELRGVRPYEHGDGRRRVHWSASAHTGDIMVRESESRTDDPIRIVVDLPRRSGRSRPDRRGGHGRGAGAVERRAAASCWRRARSPGGSLAPVADRLTAGRRLARSVASGDALGRSRVPEQGGPQGVPASDEVSPTGGTRAPAKGTGLIEMVRRANLPPPPEHSVTFRIATAVAVLTGILACAAVGEVSIFSAVIACAGTVVGMVFSYVTHNKPWQWVKLLLAVAVLGVFASFVLQIVGAAHAGQLSSIEVPLAGLFTWVQVIHSFDVPARRDLLFSLAAAGALLTVGAAQAVSIGFLGYVVIWLGACLIGLGCSWRSMTGGVGPLALGSIAATGLVVVLLGAGFLVFLPAPRAGQSITLPSSLTSYLPLNDPGSITGGGSQATEPAQAGKSSGRTGVGGFLGFANELDTATRGDLGNEVVMRVRADRPGYFLGMTYDTWDGQSWKRSPATSRFKTLNTGSPFDVGEALTSFPQLQDQLSGGTAPDLIGDVGPGSIAFSFEPANVQTFYVDQPLANLLFATSQPTEVYFPEHSLIVGGDGSMRSTIAMTPGTVYTVISADNEEPAERPREDQAPVRTGSRPVLQPDLQLPNPYQRVAALARQIVATARAKTTYAMVTALEAWMGRHVRYSTDIPPLLPGQDAVDQFLFGSRVGYCEQISTSLAVMLRTLGVPAREAIGYVPGPFDPLSDLYEIQAKDAHAWVQVWFPGVGWQSFDPTAQVPLAPPDPGAVLLSDVGHAIAGLPWVPLGRCLGVIRLRSRSYPESGSAGAGGGRQDGWSRSPPSSSDAGRPPACRRRPAETLGEYAARLGDLGPLAGRPDRDGLARSGRRPARACRLRRLRTRRPHAQLRRGRRARAPSGSRSLGATAGRHRLTTA